MMDYMKLIDIVRDKYGRNLPVITFGGSYGAMQAAWLRIKFPD